MRCSSLFNRFFFKTIVLCFLLFKVSPPSVFAQNDGNKIVGEWLNSEKDMKVQIFLSGDRYQAKVVWFACDPGFKMSDFHDKKNPNIALRSRPWLGMQVLENLRFKGNDVWSDGQIYDPNTGYTFRAVCRLEGSDALSVRGYMMYEWIGKNLKFTRVKN